MRVRPRGHARRPAHDHRVRAHAGGDGQTPLRAQEHSPCRRRLGRCLGLDLVPALGAGRRVGAAVDGTMLDTFVENPLAQNSIQYGGHGGIAHLLVADTYATLFSRSVPCGVREALGVPVPTPTRGRGRPVRHRARSPTTARALQIPQRPATDFFATGKSK
ncbi:Tn3 family transposase [Streptomyces vinaceus]|uniref:Tn3 family transposase n=1 Tax=Streptomyces vinaceus TaxID=1960 RepID=UPI00380AA17B